MFQAWFYFSYKVRTEIDKDKERLRGGTGSKGPIISILLYIIYV